MAKSLFGPFGDVFFRASAVCALALCACTKGTPEINGGSTLPFELSTASYNVMSPTATFWVSGKCDARMSDIQVSLDGGSSWVPLSSVSTTSSINCSVSQTFSAWVDMSNSTVSSAISFTSGHPGEKTLQFRGWTAVGGTQVANYKLSYSPPPPAGNVLLPGNSQGLKMLSSTNYKLQGRFGIQSHGGVSTSTNYQIKSGLQHIE